MYNIIQLNDKDLSELQQIAKELGLKKTSTLRKEELGIPHSGRTSYRRCNQKGGSCQNKRRTQRRTAAQTLTHQRKKRRRQSVHSN